MKRFLLLFLISLPIYATNTNSGDPSQGKIKASSCVFCHGETGRASNKTYPNLDMQNEMYLYLSMKSYQNGERTGPLAQMMKAQLQRLNDQDLRDIAAFYTDHSKKEPKQ